MTKKKRVIDERCRHDRKLPGTGQPGVWVPQDCKYEMTIRIGRKADGSFGRETIHCTNCGRRKACGT